MRNRILNAILFFVSGTCFGIMFVDFQIGMKREAFIALALGFIAHGTAYIKKGE